MEIASRVLGWLGTACLAASFQCKKERKLFWMQMLSGLFFVCHYGLAGDYTGMCMNCMCFLCALLLASGRKTLTGRTAMLALITAIIVLCIVTWEDVFSIFPTIALTASTIALFSKKGNIIRIVQLLLTSPGWMAYNIHVNSWPGIICESLDIGSVLIYYFRFWKSRRNMR